MVAVIAMTSTSDEEGSGGTSCTAKMVEDQSPPVPHHSHGRAAASATARRRKRPSWRGVLTKVKSSWNHRGIKKTDHNNNNSNNNNKPTTEATATTTTTTTTASSEQQQRQDNVLLLAKVKRLETQLLQMQTELDTKEETIASLEARLVQQPPQAQQESDGDASGDDDDNDQPEQGKNGNDDTAQQQQQQQEDSAATESFLSFFHQQQQHQQQHDAFTLDHFLTRYAQQCRDVWNLPVDRICVATADSGCRIWKATAAKDGGNVPQQPPSDVEDPPLEAPLAGLLQKGPSNSNEWGRRLTTTMTTTTTTTTIDAQDTTATQDLTWLSNQGYQDYFALPLSLSENNSSSSSSKFQAGISWSTKSQWTKEHIQHFQQSLPALSMAVQLGLNQQALETVTKRFEDAQGQLQTAQHRITKQGQAQIRQFAMMSHEIRTPLNCIVGLSNLILIESGDRMEESIKEPLEMMANSGDLLLAVVDDVLDYAKLAAGRVDIQCHTSHLWTSVNTVVFAIKTQARYENGVEIRTHLAPHLPRHVRMDSRRLQQILYNLLGNAIKFGREGEFVDFSVSLVEQEGDDGAENGDDDENERPKFLKFSIKDYGQGIHPDDRDRIFQPFQVKIRNEKGHGGAGLGLAITQQLVRVLGGHMTVQSEYGKGCEFQVFLPLILEGIEPHFLRDQEEQQREQSQEQLLDASAMTSGHESRRYAHIERQLSASDWKALSMEEAINATRDDSSSSSSFWSESAKSASTSPLHATPPTELVIRTPGFKYKEVTTPSPHHGQRTPQSATGTFVPTKESAPDTTVSLLSGKCPRRKLQTQQPSTNDPSCTPSKPAQPKKNTVVVDESLSKLRVLIAEDNMINQKVLIRTLKRIGIEHMDAVENGKLAVEASEAKEYDIVLMDFQMPVMDGPEATRIITSRLKHPKVVFLSAHALQEYKDQAREAGGEGFLTKPVKFDVIKEALVERVNELHQHLHSDSRYRAS